MDNIGLGRVEGPSTNEVDSPRFEGGGEPRLEGQRTYYTNMNERNLRKGTKTTLKDDGRRRRRNYVTDSDSSVEALKGESKQRRYDQNEKHKSRRRYRSGSSSSESVICNNSNKKIKSNTNIILDKFLTILNNVKSSEKPKLSFNANVIPEFDPMSKEQTVLVWINKVEECAEIYGWEEREIIHYALPKLVGVAKTWYHGLPSLLLTWGEWKKKLLESFPCREDYAELLTEMLSKRVKYGEPLEHYYYAKINLLNRCRIQGRQAVDCILYGVDDRAIKVGAQAAQFIEPEQVLKYFRTVKVVRSREGQDTGNRNRYECKAQFNTHQRFTNTKTIPSSSNIRCFNCNEIGHPSFRCDKPLIKCDLCDRLGHQSSSCFRNKKYTDLNKTELMSKTDKNEKQVSKLYFR